MTFISQLTDFEKRVLELIMGALVAEPPVQYIGEIPDRQDGHLWVTFQATPAMISSDLREKIKALESDKDVVRYIEETLEMRSKKVNRSRRYDITTANAWKELELERRDVIIRALGLWEAHEKALKQMGA